MPSSMKMAEIKRILKLTEDNADFSERKLAKIVGCSKNTIRVIKTTAKNLNISKKIVQLLDKIVIFFFLYFFNSNLFIQDMTENFNFQILYYQKKILT